MVKFTDVDFLASTTITRKQHPRPRPAVVVPGCGKLRLPIAPPSPLFAGANEDINTEASPAFEDDFSSITSELLHCVWHRHSDLCKNIIDYGLPLPPCHCETERGQKESPTFGLVGPENLLDEMIFSTIREFEPRTFPEQIIEVQQNDVRRLLSQLEVLFAACALENEELSTTVPRRYPSQEGREEQALVAVVETFFNLVYLYLDRTMRGVRSWSLTVHELRTVPHVYASTGFNDWFSTYCGNETYNMFLDLAKDPFHNPRTALESIGYGMPGEVSKVWRECLDDVLGLLIWRDAQAKHHKTCQTMLCYALQWAFWVCT